MKFLPIEIWGAGGATRLTGYEVEACGVLFCFVYILSRSPPSAGRDGWMDGWMDGSRSEARFRRQR